MSRNRLTVLILGGYGAFGGRLARRLADEPRLTLILAGRSYDKASRFCATLPQRARIQAAGLDRDGDIRRALGALKPDILVDATGPFQSPGPMPYRVVEACLALGIHYLDFADASDFVIGISALNASAEARSLVVLSGLSTFPALSGAFIDDLAGGLGRVDRVTMLVAPSPYAGVGLSVIKAIASYAGQPVPLWQGGAPAIGIGLRDTRRRTIAPPGALPLESRRFALVDVPDLRLLPARLPGLAETWAGAGTRPAVLHRGLTLVASLVRLGLLRSLRPAAGLVWQVINRARWGEDRGGFLVEVEGRTTEGQAVQTSWHLVAEGQDGPALPCLAAEAVLRGMLAGRWPAPGARPAAEAVRMADIEPLLAPLRITAGRRTRFDETAGLPLYRRILGAGWARLPQAIQTLHGSNAARRFTGLAQVERGSNILARLVAAAIGLPDAGAAVPVIVAFEVRDGIETWRRSFAGRRFASRQYEGQGRRAHLIVERFGPFAVGLAPVIEGDRLRIITRCWSFCGLPLPIGLAPGGETFEREENGRFTFHVEIASRLTGLIVRYRGWLEPSASSGL